MSSISWLDMISLPVWFWFTVAGLMGAFGRVALQVYRDNVYEGSMQKLVSLLFLGCLGGYVAWLLDPSMLSSTALGFVAPDVIENLFSKYAPDGDSE